MFREFCSQVLLLGFGCHWFSFLCAFFQAFSRVDVSILLIDFV
jgi:hypothetical protein